MLDDLEAGKPMDRLVCGDVGFGKTEVALRAAFVMAMSGKQVALICPTTLLARQHYTNFVERLQGFPIEIGRLSRLVPAAEAKKTREGLDERHRSTSSSAPTRCWRNRSTSSGSGLVIVDEEQHFGVAHKERLKALKADVHVLTLTATPIPRTLQMAMSGLRELSASSRPRRSTGSRSAPTSRRGTRSWFARRCCASIIAAGRASSSCRASPICPTSRNGCASEVPEVKAVTAHGQMSATEVEERMSAFYDRKYDVLLSTTIVESGLDIPSANTLIVHRADRFGLAQLYQLRGRVGRSKTRAYAYLTTPADRVDHRRRARSGCRCWPTSTASAPDSSSPATTSTSAAPATCSATSSRATSRRSGSSSTSRCSRTRSSS